jgi:hypothetical protein
VALSLLLSTGLASNQSALAQGLEAGAAGSLSQTSSLGPEQESLLPPEVVPLDPVVAQKMTQAQAQSRAVGMDAMPQAQEAAAAPGLAGAGDLSHLQTAQDFRKAALNSLMGQGNISMRQPAGVGLPGAPGSMAPGSQFGAGSAGQSAWISSNGGPAPQTGQSGWMQPGQGPGTVSAHPQSQTLTGSVKHKQYRRDIKRAGLSNAVSALAGFGSGMMVGSMVRNPSTAFGLGMFGLGMTGFGVRNGFRF